MSTETAPHSSSPDDDLWLVKLPDGTVRSMTVDAMDDAFQNGELDASTAVQAPDGEGWTTLGAVAGLDESADVPADSAATPATEAAPAVEAAPALEPPSVEAAPAPREPSRESIEPPSSTTPSLAPMVASIAPPSSALSMADAGPASSLDLDIDGAEAQLRAGKRKAMLGFAAVAAGVVLAGLAVSYVSGGERPEAPKAAAQPAIVAPPPAAVDPASAFEKPALTEEQKKRLSDADKARAGKKGAAGAATAAAPAAHHSKEANPFQNGGDKYDPLNGSL